MSVIDYELSIRFDQRFETNVQYISLTIQKNMHEHITTVKYMHDQTNEHNVHDYECQKHAEFRFE